MNRNYQTKNKPNHTYTKQIKCSNYHKKKKFANYCEIENTITHNHQNIKIFVLEVLYLLCK